MNGLKKEAYYTIHITPEEHCSYASFETNLSLHSYTDLIKNVLDFFKPGSFTISFFSEKPTATSSSEPFELDIQGYSMKHKTSSELEGNCDILMINYEANHFASRPKAPKKLKMPSVMAVY